MPLIPVRIHSIGLILMLNTPSLHDANGDIQLNLGALNRDVLGISLTALS